MIEKLGLANFSIRGQAFSFRDIFKYCYLKQTEIDNEDILDEKSWENVAFARYFGIKGIRVVKENSEKD